MNVSLHHNIALILVLVFLMANSTIEVHLAAALLVAKQLLKSIEVVLFASLGSCTLDH